MRDHQKVFFCLLSLSSGRPNKKHRGGGEEKAEVFLLLSFFSFTASAWETLEAKTREEEEKDQSFLLPILPSI